MTKLLIISSSSKIVKKPEEPIPALQRFDGALMRTLRKYYKDTDSIEVLILSPIYGLISAEAKIGVKEPAKGTWNGLNLTTSAIAELRSPSISTLRLMLSKKQYSEIYVNVGKELLRIIAGFDGIVPSGTRITYAQGPGIGPKMAHMRDWLKSNTIAK